MSTRLQLRRADGQVFLDRWGWECPLFGVFVHRMDASDPGLDLHDHPWAFLSWVIKGEYIERRLPTRVALPDSWTRVGNVRRQRWSVRAFGLHECHTITDLPKGPTWTVVLHGRKRRDWGFHTPLAEYGWMPWRTYEATVRAERRDVYVAINNLEEARL